jgi:hypothetical protein
MGTLLVRNTRVLVTMDDARRKISGGEMLIRDGFIEAIGERNSLAQQADEVADLSGHIVLPGFVNTHHHLYQSLDRAYAASQNKSMTDARGSHACGRARVGRDRAIGVHHRCGSPRSVPSGRQRGLIDETTWAGAVQSMKVVSVAPSSATKTAMSSAGSVELAFSEMRWVAPGGSKKLSPTLKVSTGPPASCERIVPAVT